MTPIPAHLILDREAPIPSTMSASSRRRVAELRAAYQSALLGRGVGDVIRTPEEAGSVLVPYFVGAEVESLYMLALNVRCRLIQDPILVSRGDDTGTDASTRNVLRIALTAGAVTFILGHNHPSGSTSPSKGDLTITHNIARGGVTVDCLLADHIIIVGPHVVSLRRDHPDLFAL